MAATVRGKPEGPVRLTRRGRVVLIVLTAMVLLVGLWVTAGRGEEAGAASGRARPVGGANWAERVTVGPHDTLWDIATRTRPGTDPRITVQRMIDINGLAGAIIQPGQRLVLPGR